MQPKKKQLDGERYIEVGGLVEFTTELASRLGDDNKAVWIQIAKTGAFKGHSAGPFELNSRIFGEIVRNFKSEDNHRIPIDFEHACEADPANGNIAVGGAPAQGWILDLENRCAAGLFALVEWLEPARSYIKEGKYKFFSPAIRFNSKDRVTGKVVGARLTSGALTNQPFLSGMLPMVAKDAAATDETDTDNEDETAMTADLKETPSMELAQALAELSAKKTEVAEVTLKLRDLEGQVTTLTASNKALSEEKATRDEKDLKEEVELAFETYKDSKNLSDADKDCMLIVLSANPEKFRASYPKVKPNERHLLRRVASEREPEREVPNTGGENAEEFEGMDLVTLTAKIREKSPKLSLADAQNLAAKSLGYGTLGRRAG